MEVRGLDSWEELAVRHMCTDSGVPMLKITACSRVDRTIDEALNARWQCDFGGCSAQGGMNDIHRWDCGCSCLFRQRRAGNRSGVNAPKRYDSDQYCETEAANQSCPIETPSGEIYRSRIFTGSFKTLLFVHSFHKRRSILGVQRLTIVL